MVPQNDQHNEQNQLKRTSQKMAYHGRLLLLERFQIVTKLVLDSVRVLDLLVVSIEALEGFAALLSGIVLLLAQLANVSF